VVHERDTQIYVLGDRSHAIVFVSRFAVLRVYGYLLLFDPTHSRVATATAASIAST